MRCRGEAPLIEHGGNVLVRLAAANPEVFVVDVDGFCAYDEYKCSFSAESEALLAIRRQLELIFMFDGGGKLLGHLDTLSRVQDVRADLNSDFREWRSTAMGGEVADNVFAPLELPALVSERDWDKMLAIAQQLRLIAFQGRA